MKRVFLISILFGSIYSLTAYHSDEIWYKVIEYKANGKRILNNYHYFIFDEENYLNLTIDSNEMKSLNKEQKKLYDNSSLSNYIFFVKTIGINEGIDITAQRLYDKIYSSFSTDIKKSMIALIGIESKIMKVAIGPSLNNIITDMDANAIINDILPHIEDKNYYRVAKDLIEDFKYYYTLWQNSQKSKEKESSSRNRDDDFTGLFVTLGVLAFLFVCCIVLCVCCPNLRKSDCFCDCPLSSSSGSSSGGFFSSHGGGSFGSGTLGGASRGW